MKNWWPGLFVVLAAACGFPRPADLPGDAGGDDQPTGCQRDEDCGRSTPFCVDTVCAVCKASDSCPAARPVCDLTSHDCRTCVKDSECDSGACDLAAGTCVDPGKILYASPAGTQAAPCARLLPCSLDKAASSVDGAHPYIVLLPGTHVAGATFFGQSATICGNDAIIDTGAARIIVNGNSVITLRDVSMFHSNSANVSQFGGLDTFVVNSSELTLSKVRLDLTIGGPYAISGGPKISIQKSTIIRASLGLSGNVTIDETDFRDSNVSVTQSVNDTIEITNSTFVAPPGDNVLYIADASDAKSGDGALITNNTFVGGDISCGAGGMIVRSKWFESNIFLNTTGLSITSHCGYYFNLLGSVQDLGGMGNIAGDPMFVDIAANNFHLIAGSPAIDAAGSVRSATNTHDHDGKARPQGKHPDIGAFEFSP